MKNSKGKPFLYLDGLTELAKNSKGNENIHMGIRPYGFHAGNALAIIAWPYILCEKYRSYYKTEPRFNFFISINDWEQDALDGPDYHKYPFNIYPKKTSIQYTSYKMENGEECFTADYWQSVIEAAVKSRFRKFKNISFEFVRNSQLKSSKVFQDFLIKTVKHPMDQAKIFKKYSGKNLLKKPLSFAGAICPKCHSAHGETKVENDKGGVISWRCANCKRNAKGQFLKFDFWWYHKPLLIARLKIFNIDITMSGGDHLSEGDYMIRKKLIEYFDPGIKIPKMIFTPILLSPIDGERMSKSKGNHLFADLDGMINLARLCQNDSILLPKQLMMNISDEQYKKHCCGI